LAEPCGITGPFSQRCQSTALRRSLLFRVRAGERLANGPPPLTTSPAARRRSSFVHSNT